METREILHFHFCCGIAGMAKGYNLARPETAGMAGSYRCIGGIDSDPDVIRHFSRIAGVKATVLDLFDREQYIAFHGHEPPREWREATIADIHRAAGGERPNIVCISAPCKGFSGLLSQKRSETGKYQALNRLTLRCVWLMCEAWGDDPPEFLVFENVPRIISRGSALIDQIRAILERYGYAVVTPPQYVHDCGELGGLGQHRKRFLLLGRHMAKVPPFLYEPPKRPLRAVGDVLDKFPLPGDLRGGPMHAIPNLQWKTWVRLAFVEAGSDWRSLNKLRVVDGKLTDYLLMPESRWEGTGSLGVTAWTDPSGTITGDARPAKGAFSVADPRHLGPAKFNDRFRVMRFDETSQTVTGAGPQGQSVADPRPAWEKRYNNLSVTKWEESIPTVTAGGKGVQGGALSVADPRFPNSQGEHAGKYSVQPWEEPSSTITGSDRIGSGALCVADPRPRAQRGKGDHYLTNGNYGVVPWEEPSGAVSAAANHDNGRWNVADPRLPEFQELPEASQRLIAVIRSLDGTWHRPFTTLELAALQSFVDPGEIFELEGNSDSARREMIGNAVPPLAAKAIAETIGQTLLMAWSGQTFALSAQPIWVRPIAIALSVKTPEAQ